MSALPQRHRRKAYGYVVSQGRLLVFSEPDFPEVGLQVPGGTVEPGEEVAAGLVRELTEEAGRDDFVVRAALGTQRHVYDADGMHHIHDRHFFHVEPLSKWPERWMHGDATPDLGGAPIRFEFFWLGLDDPALDAFTGVAPAFPRFRSELEAAA